MTKLLLSLCVLVSSLTLASVEEAKSLIENIRSNGKAYQDLIELTQGGPRLSGTAAAEKAVQWGKKKMESYQIDKVWLEKVTVPHWERGATETAQMIEASGDTTPLKIAALGGSVGTSSRGISAEVIEVKSLAEVDSLGEKVRGKIVFYNRPMNPNVDPFEAYGGAVDQRSAGPKKASQYGAVAAIVRSMSTLQDDDHPHTGGSQKCKIPAVAISTRGANLLSEALRRNRKTQVQLNLSAKNFPDAVSYNVIGEITGSVSPKEHVLVGGHLDSWDLGSGAHDDGAGVVQSIEVLRAVKELGLRPKRSLRAVLFMAEEQGGIGAVQYAKQLANTDSRPIAAIESDRGGFAPNGFEVDGSSDFLAKVQGWKNVLSITGSENVVEGYGGTDVEPLKAFGIPVMDFVPVSKHYFDYHHSALDQISAVDKKDLLEGAAALASLSYLLANE